MTVPRIIPRSEHPISRGYIDPDALRVLYRLHRSGFKAYLVGGSVRDLMTGRTPKDFDVGTDARPQDVRRLFRNSRVIGRRFRLAHVLFEGGKVVEVSTFRRRPDPEAAEQQQEGELDLLIRSDNVFGTPEEDAVRRDFTINGLFYDIATYAVLDYVGGAEDLAARLVRTIGDPTIRFREDPVRMMRACEFAARLNFEMTPDVLEAIAELKTEIKKSAAARVAEELLDPLRRGWGASTYALWSETGLLNVLFPELDREIREGVESPWRSVFWKMIGEADRMRGTGEALDDPALLGIVFLPIVLSAIRRDDKHGMEASRILLVLEEVVNPIAARLSLPNLTVHLVKQALYTMGRLAETLPGDPQARRLVTRPYFPAALSLLALYGRATGRYIETVATWEEVVARAGRRPRAGEDLSHAAPFPEALVPLPPPAGGELHVQPEHGHAPRPGRRRGGRRRPRGQVAQR
jgi:poly(A) polymerase